MIIMDYEAVISERVQKLKEMALLLRNIDDKLISVTKELNWSYEKLLKEKPSEMVTCSFNSQHRVPLSKIIAHEEKCSWSQQGYSATDKIFPEYSGVGSCVTLTPELIQTITQKDSSTSVFIYLVLPYFMLMPFKTNHLMPDSAMYCSDMFSEKKYLRALPQTSANFDQNFNREEKLAIYDYVIANTQSKKSFSELWLQPVEKTKEKKEMEAWEIAAAERDAKRRRASYRNKVHTNRKTYTEILREVIDSQMEAFELEVNNKKVEKKMETHKTIAEHGNYTHETTESSELKKYESSSRSNKEDSRQRDSRKNQDRYSKYRDYRRSSPIGNSDLKSGSRSGDKYRKWKTHEGRSHSHRSSKYFM